MIRNIVRINTEKCNGCGDCVNACHEKAIELRGGKAYLIRDDYCDGLGACLPACPKDAITIERREALSFDEAAAVRRPGAKTPAEPQAACKNWPIQLRLTPTVSTHFKDAHLLIGADCCAFAAPQEYAAKPAGKTLLIACPKLDSFDYTAKLAEIFRLNSIRSVEVLRMEVPCCGGIVRYVTKALEASGTHIPCSVGVFSIHGELLPEEPA